MSTLGRGHFLHLRLFIEGVEVPVIGAMVTAGENSPATAQVEIVPAGSAMRLLARSKILLFYLDYDAALPEIQTAEREQALSADQARGIASRYYRMLFSGELFTVMYTKSGAGARSLVLQCLDDGNNWDTAYLYMLRYASTEGESAIAGNQSRFLALNDNANQFDDILNQPELVITQIAKRQRAISPALRESSGLIAGLFGVLELLGGVEGEFVGVTAWHTIQEARVRLMDQIAGDSGATALEMFDNAAFESWLIGRIGDAGSVVSFRQLINLINGYIYYSVYSNPVGRYVPGSRYLADFPEGISRASITDLDTEFAGIMQEILEALRKKWNGTSPTRPVAVTTSGLRTLEERNEIRAQTGLPPLDKISKNDAHGWGFAMDVSIGTSSQMGFLYGQKRAATVEEATSLHQRFLTVIANENIGSLEALRRAADPAGERYFSDADIAALELQAEFYSDLGREAVSRGMTWGGSWAQSDPMWALVGIGGDPVHVEMPGFQDRIDPDMLELGAGAAPEVEAFYASLPVRERLLTQFFLPDIWFVAPPSCNIIFPEEISTFTYTRQMMRETTRLQLTAYGALYDETILNQVYFAPSFDQVESLAAGGLGSAAKAVIYPHEKYSGVIPKMERISEVAFYSRMSDENRVNPAAEFPEQAQGMATADNQLDTWAARTAAFNFLTHRYAARSAVASGRFMPRLACGFPAVIIDQPSDPAIDPEKAAAAYTSPVHFLGRIKTLSHSITQSGGATSVTMSHARSHKIGDETDDLFAKGIFGDRGVLSVQVDRGEPVETEIRVGDRMVPSEFRFCVAVAQHLASGGTTTSFANSGSPGPRGGVVTGLEVEAEVTFTLTGDKPALTLGTSAGPGEPQFEFPFSSLKAVEEVGGDSGLLPLEEAIRPPWFSDEYSNKQIGDLYRSLLGCGSVLDLFSAEDVTASGDALPSVGMAVERVAQDYASAGGSAGSAGRYVSALTERVGARLDQVIAREVQDGSGAVSVIPGFYYHSSGDLQNLEGEFYEWMKNGNAATQVNPGEPNKVDPQLDPRAGRYAAAVAYQADLLRSHGFRG